MKILNLPMRKKVRFYCFFWISFYQDQSMVLKYLFTRNQLLVGYILTSIVSFTSNIKLASRKFLIIFYFPKFHNEVSFLKYILRKNAFPIKMVGNRIRTFLNKIVFAYYQGIDCREKRIVYYPTTFW